MIISAIPATDKIVLPASEFTTVSETRVATWDSIGTSVSACRNLDQVPQGKTSTRFEGKFMKVTFGQPINKIIDVINNIAA